MVLPATTFLEHDDVYRGGGHQYIILGPKLVEPPGECRNNHEVICGPGQAPRRRAPRFHDEPARTDRPDAASVEARHACRARSQPLARLPAAVPQRRIFSTAFAWPDGKFRFKPDWKNVPFRSPYQSGPVDRHAAAAGSLDLDRGRRTTSIRSASPPRRRAVFSIRLSTRRRPRWRRRSGRT